jgi:hypothetical protein
MNGAQGPPERFSTMPAGMHLAPGAGAKRPRQYRTGLRTLVHANGGTMKISKLVALATLPLVLAACGDRDTADDTWTDPGLTTTPAPDAGATADTREETVNLQEVAGSGINGEARLRQMGGQTEVMVRVENAGPNQTLNGGVHHGTCEMPGDRVAELQPITTDAQGTGQAISTVNIPGWGAAGTGMTGMTGTTTPGTTTPGTTTPGTTTPGTTTPGTTTPGTTTPGTTTPGTTTPGTGTAGQPGVAGDHSQMVIAYRTGQAQTGQPVVCGELRGHGAGTTGW